MRRTGAGPPAGKRACAAVLCVTLLAVAATSAYLLASSKQRGAGGQPPASSAQDSLWSRVLEPKQVAALAHSLPHLCGDSACLDALIPYHEDDRVGLLEHGGLESALKHLKGIRRFFVLSAGNESFRHLLGSRIGWIDEARAPFTRRNFTGSSRPAGWLFQQALKFWAVKSVPELCHDVMVLDADIVWLRDFDPRVGTSQPSRRLQSWPPFCQPPPKYKYCVSSMDTGAWYGDITNDEYHTFVRFLLGFPKALGNTHTAINNWQVMQRDVLLSLEASVQDRGYQSIEHTLQRYMLSFPDKGMSEYEAYFSYVWTRYRERVEMVYLPWVLRQPKPDRCDLHNTSMIKVLQEGTQLVYLTCHDNYPHRDYLINCERRTQDCDLSKLGAFFGDG